MNELEQIVVPLMGKSEFDIESSAIIISLIASFGASRPVYFMSSVIGKSQVHLSPFDKVFE